MSSRFVLVVSFVLLALVGPAWSQPTPAAEEAAKAHFMKGKTLIADGKFVDAYREFDAGYQASPRPAFLFNMGEAARGMNDIVKARSAYERFLAVEPNGAVADTARKRLRVLGPRIGPEAPPPLAPWEPGVPTPTQAAVRVEAAVVAPSVVVRREPPQPGSRPLWKRWPVWAAVGGVVVASIVVAVAVSGDDGPSCDAADCIDLR